MLRRISQISCLIICTLVASISAAPETEKLLTTADSLFAIQMLDSAISVGKTALIAAERDPRSPDSVIASIHYLLGLSHLYKSDLNEAVSHLDSSRITRVTVYGEDHPLVADCDYYLGAALMQFGQFDLAEQHYAKALSVREAAYGPDHEQVAATLVGYSSLYAYMGRYDRTEMLVQRLLGIQERNPNIPTAQVVKALILLAGVKLDSGRFRDAEQYYRRALTLLENTSTTDAFTEGSVHWGLGKALLLQGDLPQAESHYLKAIDLTRATQGEGSYQIGALKSELGRLYTMRLQYSEAETLLTEALSQLRASIGEDNEFVAYCHQWLSRIYAYQGRYAMAQRTAEEAVKSAGATFGRDHHETAQVMNWLAEVHLMAGNYQIADSIATAATAIIVSELGETHPYLVDGFNIIGYARMQLGDMISAAKYFERSLAIGLAAGGQNHPSVAATYEVLSELRRRTGERELALDMSRRAVLGRRNNLRLGCAVMSEQEALDYAFLVKRALNLYLSSLRDLPNPNPEIAKAAAELIANTKGLVTDEMLLRSSSLRTDTSSAEKVLKDTVDAARFELASLFGNFSSEVDQSTYRSRLDSLSSHVQALEARLARQVTSDVGLRTSDSISIDRLQKELKPDQVAVEYLRYTYKDPRNQNAEDRYLVLLLNPASETRVIDLGTAELIDKAVGRYRKHISDLAAAGQPPDQEALDDYRRLAGDLYTTVWRPLEPYLGASRMIFISTDGSLNLLSFAGLPCSDNEYLIEKYRLHYLSTSRDLCRSPHQSATGRSLVLIGDPDFGLAVQPSQVDPESGSSVDPALGCGSIDRSRLSPLPGTRREVERIARLWRQQVSDSVTELTGAGATEGAFRKLAPSATTVHIATHGYLAADSCFRIEASAPSLANEDFFTRNPLLLSGLFLAGAAAPGKSRVRFDSRDGMLSAEEVATLDLHKVGRVVLSACESGLGTVESGEGVYGLRRAFQMAGAGTVISSLWKVPDNTTAQFMARLYSTDNEPVPAAMQSSCLDMLSQLRRRGQPDHPFLWAPFISIGDWRE